jgi:hypothetical protein
MNRLLAAVISASLAASVATAVFLIAYLSAVGSGSFDGPGWLILIVKYIYRPALVVAIVAVIFQLKVAPVLTGVGDCGATRFMLLGGVLGAVLPVAYEACSTKRLLTRAVVQQPLTGVHGYLPTMDDGLGTLFWIAVWTWCGAWSALAYWCALRWGFRGADSMIR